jgi:hypothetical protein
VLTIGKPAAKDLINLYPTFDVIGFVPSADVDFYRKQFAFGSWLKDEAELPLAEHVLSRSAIVCTDIHQVDDRKSLFNNLRSWLDHSPVCILTTGDRDRTADQNLKWNLVEFEKLLLSEGLNVEFMGWTAGDSITYDKSAILAVITKDSIAAQVKPAPNDFRVVAFMAAYNEEDIIVQSVRKWTDQGVSVHVLENWSTDSTYQLLKDLSTELPITVERFPKDGPSNYFEWAAMLERIEALTKEIEADWFIRRGADEVLVSPWRGVSYKDALYSVDQAGFNCIDHTIVEFHPVDNGFKPGLDHEAYFKHYDFKNFSHSNQRKAWKNSGQPISTIASAGHDVLFEGRQVYPFKFLLKHYSVRSQSHGEKKVFRERKARWNPKERALGWHIHYDSMREGHQFVQSRSEKGIFSEDDFNKEYLVERLSGIGVDR